MKLKITLTIILFVLILGFIYQTNTMKHEQINTSTFEKIKKSGHIIVGTEAAFEPFEFIENGDIKGYGPDILAYIIKDLNVELKQIDLPWQGILPGLDAGKFDFVASAVTVTSERAKKYDFTIPIADGTLAVLKLKSNNSIKNPIDISNRIVATQLGSGPLQGLRKYNKELINLGKGGVKEIKEYVTYAEAYQDLKNGRVEAIVNNRSSLLAIVQKNPDFEIIGTIGDPQFISWAVRKNDKDLLEYLNSVITRLQNDGTLNELQIKWFGEEMHLLDTNFSH